MSAGIDRMMDWNLLRKIRVRRLVAATCLALTLNSLVGVAVGQDLPKAETPLQQAIARGMEPDGDLNEELLSFRAPIQSASDALFICETLKRLPAEEKFDHYSSRLDELSDLIRHFEDGSPAADVLREKGVPQLIRIFHAMGNQTDRTRQDDQVRVLRVLAVLETREGAETIVAAAKNSVATDSYEWILTIPPFTPAHPHFTYLVEELSNPLPDGNIGVAFLECANRAAEAGTLAKHPFDSDSGVKLLRRWLGDREIERFSYGYTAALALPFLKHAERDSLFSLAMEHPHSKVRMNTAKAASNLGLDKGFEFLAKACLEVHNSQAAQEYLVELNREDLIPEAAKEPAFAAKAEFASWLARTKGLAEPPDELELVDHRELVWPQLLPPAKVAKHFWLLRFRLKDMTGLEDDIENYGLVGSETSCLFADHIMKRPIDDVYAIHWCCEQEEKWNIGQEDVVEPQKHRALLGKWTGEELEDPVVVAIVNMAESPTRRVAVATAKIEGQEGWVILDADRSQWYPASEQPPNTSARDIWRIHVGRHSLGLTGPADRKSLLAPKPPQRTPEQFLETFEKQMDEPLPSLPSKQQDRFSVRGVLGRNFAKYTEAVANVQGVSKSDAVIYAYERYLKLAEKSDPSISDDVYGISTILSENILAYVDALIEKGRTEDVAALISRSAPHMDYNLGHVQLGTAAFRINDLELANTHFQWILEAPISDFAYWDVPGIYAEVLQKRGEEEKAKDLLIRCMTELAGRMKDDRVGPLRQRPRQNSKLFLTPYQAHRTAFLKLFPQEKAELTRRGLVENPR